MRNMNEFLLTKPFDLYELFLFRLVVQQRSFTKAAQLAGLTQSAMTRQIQGMENRLGLELLERTTRSVRVTPAGDFLFHESARLTGDVEASLQRLREQFAGARKEVRVGVSRTIGLAYLPGFFHANLRHLPQVACRVSYQRSADILGALEANDLDLGVLCPPKRLPQSLRVTHRFDDAFTLLAPRELATAFHSLPRSSKARAVWLAKQPWLLIDEASNTGRKLRAWMIRQGWRVEPTMQLDGFDLIINLVALGLGISIVPIRALALYGRKKTLLRLPMRERFVRELVVVARRSRKTPEHVVQFVANVLF
jgi:DNA-binding transcriptional LysR family regulator